MNRRSFVASAGILATLSVSGCVDADAVASDDGNDTASNDDADSNGDEDSQEDMYPLIEPDPIDEIEPLAYDVAIASEVTTDSPLTIDVALTNTGEDTITYGERRDAMFWNPQGDDDFSLYPTGSVKDRYEYDDGVWWLPDGFMTTMDYQTATLEPDETHTETLALLHGPIDDDEQLRPLPPSLYFNAEFGYSADDTMPNGMDVSCGFHLRLAEE